MQTVLAREQVQLELSLRPDTQLSADIRLDQMRLLAQRTVPIEAVIVVVSLRRQRYSKSNHGCAAAVGRFAPEESGAAGAL